jgi:hypothetical protein
VTATKQIAFVRWFDASYQRGECTIDELVTRVEIESAGLLVREDEESISLAIDRYSEDETWRYISHIPKVNVLEIRRFPLQETADDRDLATPSDSPR